MILSLRRPRPSMASQPRCRSTLSALCIPPMPSSPSSTPFTTLSSFLKDTGRKMEVAKLRLCLQDQLEELESLKVVEPTTFSMQCIIGDSLVQTDSGSEFDLREWLASSSADDILPSSHLEFSVSVAVPYENSTIPLEIIFDLPLEYPAESPRASFR